MQYAQVQDLEDYFLGKTFKCGDWLTNGKANNLLIADASLINAALRVRYSLPIRETEDLILLKMFNVMLTVGTIDDVFREKTEDGRFERGRNTRKEALDWLKQVKEGDVQLLSAQGDSPIKFNSLNSDGDEIEPKFKDSNIEPTGTVGLHTIQRLE